MKKWIVIVAAIPLAVLASIAVWKLAGDDSRRQGALGSSEAVTLSWRGDYAAEAEYAPGNVVSYEGSSYVAEGEKLSTPKPECGDCGWTRLAMESASTGEKEAEPAAPAEPVMRAYEVVRVTRKVFADAAGMSVLVECPTGKMPINGGATPVPPMKVTGGGVSQINTSATGVETGIWAIQFDNTGGPERDVYMWVACARVS
jgi:hypothetical protein